MKPFLDLLKELFRSKKFVALLVGIVVTIGAKAGLDLDADTITKIVTLIATYLFSQGVADFGKEKAKIENNKSS